MNFIKEKTNLISKDELNYLNNLEFVTHQTPIVNGARQYNSFYNRMFFDLDLLPIYKKNIFKILDDEYNLGKIDLQNSNTWINKITADTNQKDDFHTDNSFVTFLTYINQNFKGGEFVYKIDITKDKTEIIKPEVGLTLIMTNKLYHKVNPVTDGVRYSLVTFFEINKKKNNTLL